MEGNQVEISPGKFTYLFVLKPDGLLLSAYSCREYTERSALPLGEARKSLSPGEAKKAAAADKWLKLSSFA